MGASIAAWERQIFDWAELNGITDLCPFTQERPLWTITWPVFAVDTSERVIRQIVIMVYDSRPLGAWAGAFLNPKFGPMAVMWTTQVRLCSENLVSALSALKQAADGMQEDCLLELGLVFHPGR